MTTARALVVRAAVRALRVALRLSGRRAGLVLVYHALSARPGDPARELVPPHALERFEAQLRHLKAHYRVVRADELLHAVETRKRGERFPVAITFDDDLPSHVELAAPVLGRLGVPATFFLCGASLERPFSFWWEHLQRAVDAGLESPVEGNGIHDVAGRIEGMSAAERAVVTQRLGGALGPEPKNAGLRREQVQALVETGLDIGFHTVRHERLPDLGDADLAAAMVEGRAALEAVVGHRLAMIAYPHGAADVRVAQAAVREGFRLGFTGRYEAVHRSSDPLLLGRIQPTFASTARFAAQLVGVLCRAPHV